MKNKGIFKFAAGFLCGALLFGAVGAVFAAGVAAGPKTAAVVIDGQTVDLKGYVVEGAHYFGLRDISEKLKPGGKDFGVTWDGANNRILIDTGTGYGPEAVSSLPAQSSGAPVAPEGVLTVPNNGDKRFVPKAGDR
ncbi:MAG: hypothetical protein LBP73_07100, partial [Clostridiales Family XIII bacterium]|nr:hypothetical protein [Clostridiales Family XIII bacterium]